MTKYGKSQTLRESTGNVQLNLFLYKIRELLVPAFSLVIQNLIENLVKKAHTLLEESKQSYHAAEDILLAELGLKDWEPTNQSTTTKSFSDFLKSGRLDAEYYQPKYDALENKISAYGSETIQALFEIKDNNYIPAHNIQYKYIELSNIGNNGEITGYTYEYGLNLPSRARRIVKTGDIIISSIEGSLQSCAIITEEYNNSICSTGFYVLTPKSINSATSLMLFKSNPIQQLMKKACSGTILTAINKDEFIYLKLPVISQNIQAQIAIKVQESFKLKTESKRLLNLAKSAVETAIEQSEQKALELLKQNKLCNPPSTK